MSPSVEALIGPREVMRRLGVADATLRYWMRKGKLPPPIGLAGSNRVAWPLDDLPRIEQRISELKARRGNGRPRDRTAA